jgi:hypothetical protein
MAPMNRKNLLLTLAVASTLCTSALASDIYRYTDDHGNVVYLDRPTGDPDGERLSIASEPTDRGAVQARLQVRQERTEAAALKKQERDDADLTLTEERNAAAAMQKQCEGYRTQYTTLSNSRRVYRTDENGERVYLDGDQSREALNKLQALINENCG